MQREDIINENHYCGDSIAVERLLSILPETVKDEVTELLEIPESSATASIDTAKEIYNKRSKILNTVKNQLYQKLNDTYKISKKSYIVSIISLGVSIVGVILGIISLISQNK